MTVTPLSILKNVDGITHLHVYGKEGQVVSLQCNSGVLLLVVLLLLK